jgi:S1-C subfamily serine protease
LSKVRLVSLALVSLLVASCSGARADGARDGIARALAYTVTVEAGDRYGAGILIAPARGQVLTSAHLVGDDATVRVGFSDGTTATGRVAQRDDRLDLAIVIIPKQERAPPLVGDGAALRAGDELYAVGNPRRLGFSVARGIVSYVGRVIDGTRYLQTDLPINPGNSGGPLINARGELVGVMSFVLKEASGLSFALPVRYAVDRFALEQPAR